MTLTMNPVRIYRVVLHCGDITTENTVSARSPGGAKYARWTDVADAFADWTFFDFLKRCRPTVSRSPSTKSYDYVRERYGVGVSPGQKVREGVVAEPGHSRESRVWIFPPGSKCSSPFHPSEIHP